MRLLIRIRNFIQQIEDGEFDGVSASTRAELQRLRTRIETLIARDRR
jgi:hypothetical protein